MKATQILKDCKHVTGKHEPSGEEIVLGICFNCADAAVRAEREQCMEDVCTCGNCLTHNHAEDCTADTIRQRENNLQNKLEEK